MKLSEEQKDVAYKAYREENTLIAGINAAVEAVLNMGQAQEPVPAKRPDLVERMMAAYSAPFLDAGFEEPDAKLYPLGRKAMAAALRVALEEALGPVRDAEIALSWASVPLYQYPREFADKINAERLARLLPAQEAKERVTVEIRGQGYQVMLDGEDRLSFGLLADAETFADGLRAGIARESRGSAHGQ